MRAIITIPNGPEPFITEVEYKGGDYFYSYSRTEHDIHHVCYHKDIVKEYISIWNPPWDFAPDWANWAAFDEDGKACWFEDKPKIEDDILWSSMDNYTEMGYFHGDISQWRLSLVERPSKDSSN